MNHGDQGPLGKRAEPRTPEGLPVTTSEPTTPYQEAPNLLESLPDATAELFAQFQGALAAVMVYVPETLKGPAREVLGHALNDAQLLIVHTGNCDGRSAARTSRSLFEHAVNVHTLLHSETAAQDYTAWGHHATVVFATVAPWLGYMNRAAQVKEKRRLERTARHARRRLASPLPSRLKPSPFPISLKGRATTAGLLDDYEVYKVLSGVVHGDPTGLRGLTRPQSDGRIIHRLGPDLDLCALSFVPGLQWFQRLIATLDTYHPNLAAPALNEAIEKLLAAFGDIRKTLQRLDRKLWPTDVPPSPFAIWAIYQNGERWYLLDPHTQTLIAGDPDPETLASIAHHEPHLREQARQYWAADQRRPFSVACPTVLVTPRPSATRAPMTAVLVPKVWMPPSDARPVSVQGEPW